MTTSSTEPFAALGQLLKAANHMSRLAIWAAGGLTLISAIYITIDVILRKVTSAGLGGSDELSGYAFAISVSWAFAFATLQRANIRIDALYQLLPVRVSALLDWVALVGLGVFFAWLTFYACDVATTSWSSHSTANTALGTPLWIPQFLWLGGLFWMCLVLALMLIRASLALVTGDLDRIKAICGMRSSQEEAQEEAESSARLLKEDAR
jgi:TRAP-type C4-dicarboxylate transport system permease small subunit